MPDLSVQLEEYFPSSTVHVPVELLEREYLILSEEYTNETIIYPYELLMAVPQIRQVLERYTFMRADIQVKIQLTSAPSVMGCFYVTPFYNVRNGAIDTFVERGWGYPQALSAPDCMLLDVSRREGIEFTIPYISSAEYIFMPSDVPWTYAPPNGFRYGVRGLDCVDSTVTNPVVTFEAWASFKNIQLAGPQDIFVTPGQMDAATRASIAGIGLTTFLAYGQKDIFEPIVHEVTSRVGQKVKTEMFGEDGDAAPMRVSPYGPLTSSTYDNRSQYMGGRRLSTLPEIAVEGKTAPFNFYDIAKIPAFVNQSFLAQGAPANLQLWPVGEGYRGWPLVVTKMFRMWRGSQKVHLRFITSTLVVGRVGVLVTWGDAPSSFPLTAGDLYTQVVSIQGTTDVTFTVPFVSDQHWSYSDIKERTPAAGTLTVWPKVYVYLLSANTAVGDQSPVFLMGWTSFADDLVMRFPQSLYYEPDDDIVGKEAEGQMNLTSLHSNQAAFPSITGKLTAVTDSRDVETLTEYLNRYSDAHHETFSTMNSMAECPRTGMASNFDRTVWMFARYYSGSIRYKIRLKESVETANPDVIFPNSGSKIGATDVTRDLRYETFDGVSKGYQGVWQILEFEVPYVSPYSMLPVEDPNVFNFYQDWIFTHNMDLAVQSPSIVTAPNDVTFACKAAGKDFALHVLAWPPGVENTPPIPFPLP